MLAKERSLDRLSEEVSTKCPHVIAVVFIINILKFCVPSYETEFHWQ